MINPDELEPARPALKPLDLQQMSVEELKDYIAALEAEIARADGMISKKEAHKSGVDALSSESPKVSPSGSAAHKALTRSRDYPTALYRFLQQAG